MFIHDFLSTLTAAVVRVIDYTIAWQRYCRSADAMLVRNNKQSKPILMVTAQSRYQRSHESHRRTDKHLLALPVLDVFKTTDS